jgi:hypothetical protein
MARTAGAENKSTPTDSESKFLKEVLEGFTSWKKEARRLKDNGEKCDQELEYAEAYRLMLNKFSETQDSN